MREQAPINNLIEKTLSLEGIDPREVYGMNNTFLNQIKAHFPDLKITARGHKIKVNGAPESIENFAQKIAQISALIERYNTISGNQLEKILNEEAVLGMEPTEGDLILHGVSGQPIKARTVNQKTMVTSLQSSDMLFAIGPAGTGKTYTAVALAVRALKNKEVRRIILTRPAVEAGENLGFLPGDLTEKLDPYLQPLYDALREMIPSEKLAFYLDTEVIQIAPLAFMRGRTLDRAFVILDEAQNTSHSQMKMFLTRMGRDAKFVVTGDASQIDLPRHQKSGLKEAERLLRHVDGIRFVYLTERDVIRHRLVKAIIRAYDLEENP